MDDRDRTLVANQTPCSTASVCAPDDRAFLTAEWRWLAILNYVVDPSLILPYVPDGVEIDDENGKVYLSVVGFLFLRTRVMGLSIPWHRDFPEVNLRIYVRRKTTAGWQHGITFIRELVSKPLVSWVARLIYNEPYRTVPLRCDVPTSGDVRPPHAQYMWTHRGRKHAMRVTPREHGVIAADGTHEAFITERAWGFTPRRSGGASVYRVSHPAWRVYPAQEARLDVDVATVWGAPFATALGGPPVSAFLAEGSAVTVFRGRPL